MATQLTGAPSRVPRLSPTTVFDRVVCTVERSHADLAPAPLAVRLVAPDGELTIAVHARWLFPFEDERRAEARVTLERAWAVAEEFPGARATLLVGRPADVVLEELVRRDATLAVAEIREHHRAIGIVEDALATTLLHDAPCSVLVAGRGTRAPTWPESIVVGLDGSVESAAAAGAAWDLGARLGAPVRVIAATECDHADLELVRRIAPDFEQIPDHPVSVLVDASHDADLLVVGSRGLRGLRALGSVSERVAHCAACPVLVVRDHPRAKGVER
jgi:nucleotide-binding universal stress UspA family protein